MGSNGWESYRTAGRVSYRLCLNASGEGNRENGRKRKRLDDEEREGGWRGKRRDPVNMENTVRTTFSKGGEIIFFLV